MNNKKQIWFGSDYHFHHGNIIKYCSRPFNNINEMNNTIINNHNSVVKPDDDFYFLGDFCFHNQYEAECILERLNGNKYFIIGNHDNSIMDSKRFNIIGYSYLLNYKNYPKIYISHCCSRLWIDSHKGSWHLFGHHHGTLTTYNMSIDVGVDSNDLPKKYTPVSIDEIQKIMTRKIDALKEMNRYKIGYRSLKEKPYYDQDDVSYFQKP